jgi:hypothetical protein
MEVFRFTDAINLGQMVVYPYLDVPKVGMGPMVDEVE